MEKIKHFNLTDYKYKIISNVIEIITKWSTQNRVKHACLQIYWNLKKVSAVKSFIQDYEQIENNDMINKLVET